MNEKLNPLNAKNTGVDRLLSAKQDRLTGTKGQVVGFDADGNAAPEQLEGRYQPIVAERISLGTTTEEAFEEVFQEIFDAMAANSVECRFFNATFTSGKGAISSGSFCILFFKPSNSYGLAIAMRYSGSTSPYPSFRVRNFNNGVWSDWVKNWNGETASASVLAEAQEALVMANINTLAVSDATALRWKELYPVWAAGTAYESGNKTRHGAYLYRCLQGHTAQADWEPGVAVSLWEKLAEK